jgi:hypothetical protein
VRRRVVAAVVVTAVAVSVAAAVAAVARRPEPLTAKRLAAYTDAIAPPLSDGGRVVEQGMKPGVADLLNRHAVPPATIAVEAAEWERELTRVRGAVAAVPVPPGLGEAAALFDRALAGYVEAAELFRRAALAPEGQRRAIADRGFTAAEAADRTYDAASRIVQRERRRLGLGPTATLPDPTPT